MDPALVFLAGIACGVLLAAAVVAHVNRAELARLTSGPPGRLRAGPSSRRVRRGGDPRYSWAGGGR